MSDLTQLTVNLTPDAASALEQSAERERLSKTDVVNLALLAYEQLSAAEAGVAFRLPREPRRGGDQ